MPSRTTCRYCDTPVSRSQPSIECRTCRFLCHRECTNPDYYSSPSVFSCCLNPDTQFQNSSAPVLTTPTCCLPDNLSTDHSLHLPHWCLRNHLLNPRKPPYLPPQILNNKLLRSQTTLNNNLFQSRTTPYSYLLPLPLLCIKALSNPKPLQTPSTLPTLQPTNNNYLVVLPDPHVTFPKHSL